MRRLAVLAATTVAAAVLIGSVATGRDGWRPLGSDASFTTVHKNAQGIEGLTADKRGNLYTGLRVSGAPCDVIRVPSSGGAAVKVGELPAPCGPAGIAFDHDGDLFIADGEEILTLRPSASNPPVATVFATGVPGANGIAFDRRGALWVSDGTTGQGRVWRLSSSGEPTEVFRVQPMVNTANTVAAPPEAPPGSVVGGVGRDLRSAPPATVLITPSSRQGNNVGGSQHLVANGLAFGDDGELYVADTARGAIWEVELDRRGGVRSPTGCDTTFPANTLCLDNVLVAHPYLEGVDGIAIDRDGTIVGAINERNAVVAVTKRGRTIEVFRSPVVPATQLRNEGPLEFPTSPVLIDRKLCLAHSDGSRRDNFPNSGGEVGPGKPEAAKISCLRR